MLRSPAFWLLFVAAIVIDGILLVAWRRKRGLPTSFHAVLDDSLNAPRALLSRIKVWKTKLPMPTLSKPEVPTIKLPSFSMPDLSGFSLPNLSIRSPFRWAWQFVVPLGLAGIPVWLVFKDRWLMAEPRYEGLRTMLCSVDALCKLQLPAYFVVILGVLILLFVVVGIASRENVSIKDMGLAEVPVTAAPAPASVSARQRGWGNWLLALSALGLIVLLMRAWRYGDGQPGAEYAVIYLLLLIGIALREIPVAAIGERLREQGLRWLFVLLAHLALVWLLVSVYDAQRSPWLALVVTLAAYANLWRYRKQVSPVFWLVSAALLVYTLYINAWWTSIAGDDYAFLNDAILVLEQPWSVTAASLFRGAFTYGSHPYLTNIIQAAFLKIFGVHNFAWRFSSIYVAAMSLPFFYAFLKSFLQQRTALLITILLAGSHYIISFSRIGYNNMQALFTTALMLYLAAVALRSSGLRSYAALGAAMGLSFYAFPGAILALPLPLLLLLIYKGLPTSWLAIKQWGTTAIVSLLLIAPLFFQPLYWTSKFPGSFLTSAVRADTTSAFHTLSNLVYAIVSPLYFIEESHFVVVGFIDVFSAGLFFLGFSYLAWRWRGQRFLVFMLLSYVFMLLAVGVIHNYLTPPATRMFMLLPWYVFFAGAGVLWIGAQVQRVGFSARAINGLVGICVVLLLGVNVYQGYRLSFERSPRYHNFISMLLGATNDFFSQPENADRRILIMNDSGSLHMPNFWRMLDLYQVPVDDTNFQAVRVFGNPEHTDIVPFEAATAEFSDPEALIMVNPSLAERAPDLLEEYEDYLRSIGKQRCDVLSFTGHLRFWFWYSPELEEYCPPGL